MSEELLIKFILYLKLEGAIDLSVNEFELSRSYISKFPSKKLNRYAICDIVCIHMGVSFDEMCENTRKGYKKDARQMAMYFLKKYQTELSFSSIGNIFRSNDHVFDHSTVMHACKTVRNLIDTNKIFRDEIAIIENKILQL